MARAAETRALTWAFAVSIIFFRLMADETGQAEHLGFDDLAFLFQILAAYLFHAGIIIIDGSDRIYGDVHRCKGEQQEKGPTAS